MDPLFPDKCVKRLFMLKYIIGRLKNLFNPAIALFTLIDNESTVDHHSRVYSGTKIFRSSLGKYSYVGKRSSLVYAEIGSFCSIAGGVCVGLGEHTLSNLSTSPIFTERKNGTGHSWTTKGIISYSKVTVGNDVWIGERAMIIGGCTIGDGAVIAAGAIVTKNVPPYAIVAGVPAKIIRYRFDSHTIEELLKLQWWNLPESILRQNIGLFQTEEDVCINKLKEITFNHK